ncbi:phenylalanine--tRNA ligase subunit beta [Bifidobacterium callitrichos]|uniref:Phenylalanine--tRNA ligase beta subunit n=1 Tax=Bifidobacterium callitrichos TaxID=762209 RepID=A0A5M9ZBH7_9BIFI|nr:phenylalanine--tRNA ligase subunit beta [Bifidobacterium callitrichos]KAA8815894.1 phenylalanine--tRNA ligase subunit beta [Bifidobacterium callitrichos]
MPMVDIDWLKEHVEVPEGLTYEQLAKDLVKVGLEEEQIHASQVTGPIVVGYVVDATPEPQKNGKVINWCHVDVGPEYNETDENGNKVPRGIICGAPNMAAGEKVVVTLPGAVLPGDFRIEPRKTYGHISNGMCASERELGLGDDHNGIILLRHYGFTTEEYEALKPGDDAMHLLHLDQPLLEINITPDRGYTLSYRGVAREFHHSTGAAYTDPVVELNAKVPEPAGEASGTVPDVQVEIEDDNPIHGVPGCDRYYARVIRGFDPNSHTPNWMRRRLIRAGMRSISLAVDVTNYVMLDLGQPMHAYDLDKLEAPIVVRRAKEGEKLTTLDGKEHELSVEDLLITDSPNGERASRIIGLAGVMGGLYGEVTAETKNILLEAAHFDQVTIARSARRHKIPSEASRRFERGVDYELQPAAAQMAVDLLVKYGDGEPSEHPTDVNHTAHRKAIHFKASEVRRVAGLDTPVNEISDILTDIGCKVAGGGNGEFVVTPPTWRPDLNEPCDLVEEVARLVGYDEIPVTVPPAPVEGLVGLTPDQLRRRRVADELAEYGMVEALSYPFVGDADYKAFGYDAEATKKVSVEIANPLYGDRPFLRRHILPTLAGTVQRNIRRGIENVSLYELGHVYLWNPDAPAIPALPGGVKPTDEQLAALDAGLPDQPDHVAGILTGLAEDSGWLGGRRPVDWSDAVEAVRRIADRLGARISLEQPAAADVPVQWHPGRFANVKVGDLFVGLVGELHPHVNEELGFPEHSAAFELNLTALFSTLDGKPVQARPISTFPPVKQDLAFTVDDTVTAAQLEAVVREAAGANLESIELFDVFTGDALGEGKKSLAFAVVFRSPDRTLSAEDSEAIRKAIIDKAAELGAQLRA